MPLAPATLAPTVESGGPTPADGRLQLKLLIHQK